MLNAKKANWNRLCATPSGELWQQILKVDNHSDVKQFKSFDSSK
jgi:hypothetical protein